jgi:hypothetical protein
MARTPVHKRCQYQDRPSVIGRRISYQNDGIGCTMIAGKVEQRE